MDFFPKNIGFRTPYVNPMEKGQLGAEVTQELPCNVLGTFAATANKSDLIKPKWIYWIYARKSEVYIGWGLKAFSVLYSGSKCTMLGYKGVVLWFGP